MIDIALALHQLVPNAAYSGATDLNTEQQYDDLRWTDERPKPSFSDIVDLCANEEFVLWSQRLMAPPATRSDIGLRLRSEGLLTRSEAVAFANGSFPDPIYDQVSAAVGEDEAFRLEMLWAGSTRHQRLSEVLDTVADLGYGFEKSIDEAFGITATAPGEE